jgi:hypothetical protein
MMNKKETRSTQFEPVSILQPMSLNKDARTQRMMSLQQFQLTQKDKLSVMTNNLQMNIFPFHTVLIGIQRQQM